MIEKREFAGFMVRLAMALPRFAPNIKDHDLLQVWYEQIGERVEPDELQRSYRECVAKLDAFPSIRQILDFAGKAPQSDEDKARDVAERIYGALCKGWASSLHAATQAKRDEYVGPIGVEVVKQQGGWNNLAETVLEDDATTWKAQWRGLAEVIVRRGPIGLDQGPRWESLPGVDLAKMLPNVVSVTGKKDGT